MIDIYIHIYGNGLYTVIKPYGLPQPKIWMGITITFRFVSNPEITNPVKKEFLKSVEQNKSFAAIKFRSVFT